MSTYATSHHPQVQDRKVGQMAMNDFPRDWYVSALEQAGYRGVRSLSKSELFAMVKAANIPATTLQSLFGRCDPQGCRVVAATP